MSSVLSQEEIDTLLSGLSGGDLTLDPDGDSGLDGRADVANFNFFNQALRELFHHLNLFYGIPAFDALLPVGISFYTFQSLSYTIDV